MKYYSATKSRVLFLFVVVITVLCIVSPVAALFESEVVIQQNTCCGTSGGMNQTINLSANMTAGSSVNDSYYMRNTYLPITGTDIERNGVKSWLSLLGGTKRGDGGEVTVFGNESTKLPGGMLVNVSGADGITPTTAFYVEGLTDTPELNMNKNKIVDMDNPTAASDAATKYYHDHNIINTSYMVATDLNSYYLNDTSKPIFGDSIERNINNSQLALYGGDGVGGSGALFSVMGNAYAPAPGAIFAYVVGADNNTYQSAFHMLGKTDTPTLYMEFNNITNIVTRQNTDVVNKSYVDAATGSGSAINESYAYLPGRPGGQLLNGGTGNNENLTFNATANGVGYVVLQPKGGNIGIGNKTPESMNTRSPVLVLASQSLTGKFPGIVFQSSNYTYPDDWELTLNAVGTPTNGADFRITEGVGVPRFVVQHSTGYIGVGTQNPGYPIHVSTTSGNAVFVVTTDASGTTNAANVFFGTNKTNTTPVWSGVGTYNGNLVLTRSASLTGSPHLVISSTGNVTLPYSLRVNGTETLTGLGAGTMMTDANGNVYVISDPKYKSDIKPYTSGLSKILNVNPITFKFTPESGLDTVNTYTGFNATQLKTAIPEAVFSKLDTEWIQQETGKITEGEKEVISVEIPKLDKNGNQTYTQSVDDRAIISTLINAIKEQQTQINDLNTRLKKLEGIKP